MATDYTTQEGTLVSLPSENDVRDMGEMLQAAQDDAKKYASGIMALVAESNTSGLLAYLQSVRTTLATHSGNASRRIAYTLAIIAQIEETLSECGDVITPRYHDVLLAQVLLLARHIPASVQAKDSESGKNVRDEQQSNRLRGLRSVGTAFGRVQPRYIPSGASDARTTLENVLKIEADREVKRQEAEKRRVERENKTAQIAAPAETTPATAE